MATPGVELGTVWSRSEAAMAILKIYGREQENGGRLNKFGPYSMTKPR